MTLTLFWSSFIAQLVKNPPAMWESGFDPWVGEIPWRRERLPTPVLLPGEFHGQRSLTGYSPWDFPGKTEDSGPIPGLGRSAGERIGYPLQYFWASLVAQLVKNPPAKRDTRIRSLGWGDPLEKGTATHSSILAWRTPWTIPWDHKESDTDKQISLLLRYARLDS